MGSAAANRAVVRALASPDDREVQIAQAYLRYRPVENAADTLNDWKTFDPGPKHTCASGNNPYAPLADTAFDTASDEASSPSTEPNGNGSSFELEG